MSHARAALAAAAALALGSFLACGAPPSDPATSSVAGAASAFIPADDAEPSGEAPAGLDGGPAPSSSALTLFFVDRQGSLVAESRELPDATSDATAGEARVRATLDALLQGPRGRLASALPAGATLRAAYLVADGTAYVDMDAAFARGLSSGSEDALLAVSAITNSLAVSVQEVRRVRFLIEGEEVRDLGGHLDLTRPVLPDLSQVRPAATEPAAAPPPAQ